MVSKVGKEQGETGHPRWFDPASEDDTQELKNWCSFHWEQTVIHGIKTNNAAAYHYCCLSFSKKGCLKKNTHPPFQSASVLKIPGLRNARSPADLYKWLRERIADHQRLGKKAVFPSVNMPHIELDSEEESGECQSAELLKKRCEDLDQKIRQLADDNQRLLASSKCWCLKYQELLASREEDKYSFGELTPQKAVKTDDSNSSLLFL